MNQCRWILASGAYCNERKARGSRISFCPVHEAAHTENIRRTCECCGTTQESAAQLIALPDAKVCAACAADCSPDNCTVIDAFFR